MNNTLSLSNIGTIPSPKALQSSPQSQNIAFTSTTPFTKQIKQPFSARTENFIRSIKLFSTRVIDSFLNASSDTTTIIEPLATSQRAKEISTLAQNKTKTSFWVNFRELFSCSQSDTTTIINPK